MKIGEEALAVVRQGISYRIVPVTVTGVMDTAKSVSTGSKDFKEVKRFYQVDSPDLDFLFDNMVSEENIFPIEAKEQAISRRNELLGIKSKETIEHEKLEKARKTLETLKEKGKWETKEEIEETLVNLIKEGTLNVQSKELSRELPSIESYDPFRSFERRLARLF